MMHDSEFGPENRKTAQQGGSARLPRLLLIIETLQSGRLYNSQELATLCGVSRRTVFRDIAALQQAGLSILQDEARQGYYLPHRLAFPHSELSLSEALSLVLLCQELGGSEVGGPFQSAARSASQKICRSLPTHIRELVGEVAELMSIDLDAEPASRESQSNYELVLRALLERRQLQIDYQDPPAEGRSSTVLDIYRVIFRRHGWYVVGRSSLHREVRVVPLGRIERAEALNTHYEIPPRFSLERFLGNAWHLQRDPQGPSQVVIRFAPSVAQRVAEVRWHKTQITTFLPDGRLEFRVTVDGLKEIAWWILGYGDQAEVIQPPALRDRIRDHAQHMLARYSEPPVEPGS